MLFRSVVAPPVQRVRTIAAGVIVDPNITTPLPLAGLSYVDFNLFRTGTQFSGFFGGSYAQAAFSSPSVRGTRWQLAGRAFAIATSYNDRAFVDGRELYDRDITQRHPNRRGALFYLTRWRGKELLNLLPR